MNSSNLKINTLRKSSCIYYYTKQRFLDWGTRRSRFFTGLVRLNSMTLGKSVNLSCCHGLKKYWLNIRFLLFILGLRSKSFHLFRTLETPHFLIIQIFLGVFSVTWEFVCKCEQQIFIWKMSSDILKGLIKTKIVWNK